mmetsp:Transcript_39911/g.105440  ORF Transcript_39911/g.105440 Transcript_39911/m.105440 type:complete len:282 (-) Transcript_39911:8-853(-)
MLLAKCRHAYLGPEADKLPVLTDQALRPFRRVVIVVVQVEHLAHKCVKTSHEQPALVDHRHVLHSVVGDHLLKGAIRPCLGDVVQVLERGFGGQSGEPYQRAAVRCQVNDGSVVDLDDSKAEGPHHLAHGVRLLKVLTHCCHKGVGHVPVAYDEVRGRECQVVERHLEPPHRIGPLVWIATGCVQRALCALRRNPDPDHVPMRIAKEHGTVALVAVPHLVAGEVAHVDHKVRIRRYNSPRLRELTLVPMGRRTLPRDALDVPLAHAPEDYLLDLPVNIPSS